MILVALGKKDKIRASENLKKTIIFGAHFDFFARAPQMSFRHKVLYAPSLLSPASKKKFRFFGIFLIFLLLYCSLGADEPKHRIEYVNSVTLYIFATRRQLLGLESIASINADWVLLFQLIHIGRPVVHS